MRVLLVGVFMCLYGIVWMTYAGWLDWHNTVGDFGCLGCCVLWVWFAFWVCVD